MDHLEAKQSPDKPGAYYIADYVLYRNTITKLLEDVFEAHPRHAKGGNETVFNKDKLKKLKKFYDTQILIKTRLIEEDKEDEGEGETNEKGEGGEGGEGSRGESTPL